MPRRLPCLLVALASLALGCSADSAAPGATAQDTAAQTAAEAAEQTAAEAAATHAANERAGQALLDGSPHVTLSIVYIGGGFSAFPYTYLMQKSRPGALQVHGDGAVSCTSYGVAATKQLDAAAAGELADAFDLGSFPAGETLLTPTEHCYDAASFDLKLGTNHLRGSTCTPSDYLDHVRAAMAAELTSCLAEGQPFAGDLWVAARPPAAGSYEDWSSAVAWPAGPVLADVLAAGDDGMLLHGNDAAALRQLRANLPFRILVEQPDGARWVVALVDAFPLD